MAISRGHQKKSPTQNPVDFALLKQAGGATGTTSGRVPDKLSSPKPCERIYGTKAQK